MEDNAAVVRQAYRSFVQGDIPAVIDLLDPGVHWSVPRTVPQGGEFQGQHEVLTFFKGLDAAWRPLALELEALDAVGSDLVVGIVNVSGILAGDPVAYGAVHVFTVDGGRITRFREYLDLDGALVG